MNGDMNDATIFVAATGNAYKLAELTDILAPLSMRVISFSELGITDFEPEETGDSFEENSLIKARALRALTDMPVIADDSGLSVDALCGAPGVYSARFASLDADGGDAFERDELSADERNNRRLLRLMEYIPEGERGAQFVCAVTAILGDGTEIQTRGVCRGLIGRQASGMGGFGYDPLFVPAAYAHKALTFSDISPDEKNRISHRAMALAKLSEALKGV